MIDVSIIIVNWNARDLLSECLAHLHPAIDELSAEVFVVDNASQDGSAAMVKEEFSWVRLIENAENIGFARANNQAIKLSAGQYILLLNNDAFVRPDTVVQMLSFMQAHPEAGMSGCKLFFPDGALQYSCSSFPTLFTELCGALYLDRLFPRSRLFGKYLMTYWGHNDVREVDAVLGACMLVRRRAIDQVGLMDEKFFMYSEEVDWCYRFKKAGWKVYYVPHAQAIHIWGGSSKQVEVGMFVQMYRSRVAFFQKHYGRLSALLMKSLLALACVIRLAVGPMTYLAAGSTRERIKQKHRCYWSLFKALPAL